MVVWRTAKTATVKSSASPVDAPNAMASRVHRPPTMGIGGRGNSTWRPNRLNATLKTMGTMASASPNFQVPARRFPRYGREELNNTNTRQTMEGGGVVGVTGAQTLRIAD